MSRPRAATSVATSSGDLCSLKEIITPSRWPWLMSPCSAFAWTPRSRRARSSRAVPILVRQKTIACSGSSAFSTSIRRLVFSFGSTWTKACSIASTVSFLGVIEIVTGSYM